MTDERDEILRSRLKQLRSRLEDGTLGVSPEVFDGLKSSLLKVRTNADGDIDLATVDTRLRSLASVIGVMDYRQGEKNAISLRDIHQALFEHIEKNFSFIIRAHSEKRWDIGEFAYSVSKNADLVRSLAPAVPQFLDNIREFWKANADASHFHIQDLEGIKAVYGGDLFPDASENIASTSGLYVDTIVLSDPFLQSQHIFKNYDDEIKVRYFVKHMLNMMQYKDLVVADSASPIVAISPFRSSIDSDERQYVLEAAEQDGLSHAGRLFGRTFGSGRELVEYAERFPDAASLLRVLANPDRLLFDTEWTEPLPEQLQKALAGDDAAVFGGHAGRYVAATALGRMGQASDLLIKSRYLGGTPLLDAPTSWRYLNWKLEYNAGHQASDGKTMHMLRGLQQAASSDMQWLGNVPPAVLIELRRDGALAEIRNMLSDGVSELAESNPGNFFRVSDRIVGNIQRSFETHQKKVEELRMGRLKFFGHDIGLWLVSGAIEIAAAASGAPAFGLAAVGVSQLTNAPRLADIPQRYRDMRDAERQLSRTPFGIFFGKNKQLR